MWVGLSPEPSLSLSPRFGQEEEEEEEEEEEVTGSVLRKAKLTTRFFQMLCVLMSVSEGFLMKRKTTLRTVFIFL